MPQKLLKIGEKLVLTKNEKAIVWLNLFNNLTYNKKQMLLQMYPSAGEMFDNFLKDKQKILNIIDTKTYDIMAYANTDSYIDVHLKDVDHSGIKIITLLSDSYPESLKNIDSPPLVLYCKGNIDLLKTDCFAVVGTRHISNYGRTITEKFTKGLVGGGFTIVSGMSTGVDTIAHQTTIDNKGKTIAVLAGGFDYIYPSTNFNLSKQIESTGLLITECKPNERAQPYYFPIRNRIIAGLSKGVLITEADENSGSMHTKNYAIENNIDVYAIPGNITSKTSNGCNRAISNGQAKAVLDISDILDCYNIKYQPKQQVLFEYTPQEKQILDAIGNEEMSFGEIMSITKFDVKTLNTLLTTMSIRGIIKKLAGNIYSK